MASAESAATRHSALAEIAAQVRARGMANAQIVDELQRRLACAEEMKRRAEALAQFLDKADDRADDIVAFLRFASKMSQTQQRLMRRFYEATRHEPVHAVRW